MYIYVFKTRKPEMDDFEKKHLPKIRTFKIRTNFFGQPDRQTDIVVHREVTLPNTSKFRCLKKYIEVFNRY